MKTILKLVLLPLLAFTTGAIALVNDGSGLKVSASVDTVGSFDVKNDSGALNRVLLREAELLVYSPIDHLFDGLLNVAAHNEMGGYRLEVHEAYIGSTRLIPRSRFRVGQFFMGFGRLNQFHRHDWPFITAPIVNLSLFGEEGATETGAEYNYLFPTPFFLDLTIGVTNGWKFGHADDDGVRPNYPTYYLRSSTYLSLPWQGGMQVGVNYIGRSQVTGSDVNTSYFDHTYWGLDLTAKWREATRVLVLLQAEVWYHDPRPGRREIGSYLFGNYHIDSGFYAGCRFDVMNQFDGAASLNYAIVPTLMYQSSEFATFRLAYTYNTQQDGASSTNRQLVQVQAVFNLGAHPAHDF